MIDPKNDSIRLRQLPLDLQIEEDGQGVGGSISPEEAGRRSEAARMSFEELRGKEGETPRWMEDYLRLREVGWPWRVACYIAWASSPKKGRQPKTQEELATMYLGLTSDRQIGTWRKKNRVIDETVSLLQAAPLFENRRDVIEALIASATNPDYKGKGDRELLLKLTGDLVDKRELRVRGRMAAKTISAMSDEELREWAGELSAEDDSVESAAEDAD